MQNDSSGSLAVHARVRHGRFGFGKVVLDNGPTVIVRFDHGLEECLKADLQSLVGLQDMFERPSWDIPLEVIHRTQAAAIISVNDAWGVFSRSKIELLPHQLWVCRKVNAQWPTRWLVADDVGLGKTIEAGLILWPLLAKGVVRRLLVLCPASLADQWQYRLRTMFDIRLAKYSAENDTNRSDFWGTHSQVVASLETLRLDSKGRHQRLLEGEPWDLVIVDEAHHLNTDEKQGPTKGWRLVRMLDEERRVRSMVFFTGTPHRGKNYGFLSLLQLLKPDTFDPHGSFLSQLRLLSGVMIRNNKAGVTDLKGKRLFFNPNVLSAIYSYSKEEARFYQLLTQFISTGRAYASSLGQTEGRAVILVLIAMQKLASSSVAAIKRAVRRRLKRIQEQAGTIEALKSQLDQYERLEGEGVSDAVSQIEEELASIGAALRLMKDEESRLHEILEAAEAVTSETKIACILNTLEEKFSNRPILFFTEYKATQSLLMSALIRQFGPQSVTFINGDDRAEDVEMPDRTTRTLYATREDAVSLFNEGKVRFLISTEAGGEGIDLQENCHSLIHVDLPWNPMRLHQRVGRLNRYGQTKIVDVLTFRNPDTVESLIWEKLNQKLHLISMAFGQVTDEPEDMLQLVLGMTSPALFREIFAESTAVPRESISSWFDQKTAQFGGQDAIETVRGIVGNVTKFDFHQISERLPKVDLPDLQAFFEIALTLNGRRSRAENGSISFLTPEPWKVEPGVLAEYKEMRFERSQERQVKLAQILGVGHKVVDLALRQATEREGQLAALPRELLPGLVIAVRLRDRITTATIGVRSTIVGVQFGAEGQEPHLLADWQLLKLLNDLPWRKAAMGKPEGGKVDTERAMEFLSKSQELALKLAREGDFGFQFPEAEILSVLWPSE